MFSLSDDEGGDEFYTPTPRENGEVRVAKRQGSVTLVQYLNEYYLDFFTASGALLSGNELFAPLTASSLLIFARFAVPEIVPVSSKNRASRATSSQLAQLRKWLRDENLRGKTWIAEMLIGV